MDYLLGEVIYQGTDTRVFAGEHRESKVPVVIKMPCHEPAEKRIVARLEHEYALLCELDLEGMVRALELAPLEGGVALVLERWGECSLDRMLDRGPLPLEAVLRLGAALARSLGELHCSGVLHRDIKPQNVLVDAACTEVRLVDFGTALRKGPTGFDTSAESGPVGTLAYMAPEQTGRMNRGVDARADLYALGVTLYQMLTAELPFEMTDELELIHAHIARRPATPAERAPRARIPVTVSEIVMRLLEKSPEDRYHSAFGVAWDLERALRELSPVGAISAFELGSHDWEDRIRRPSRLFGREQEQAALSEAFASVRRGDVALVLMAGPSGVGKSALALALREEVRDHQGTFASGKFDLLQRGTPCAAIAQAFGGIARRRLADSPEDLERFQQVFRAAVGGNARIVVDLAPELARIVGDTSPLMEVGPADAKNRFLLTVQRFVRVMATAEHPLVLFIDDLQWADALSLSLLSALVTDPEMKHLLLLGAYRDNEVDQAHPLHAFVAAAVASGRGSPVHALGPLNDAALSGMVEDMLFGVVEGAPALCKLVKAKTDGSPFFVEQFLRALAGERLLSRDLTTGQFQWDAERIERATVTENVAPLLTDRIGRLPAELRRALAVGACVGASFTLDLVRATGGFVDGSLERAIEALLHEGLLVRAGDGVGRSYEFVHDRVQQASYELLAEEERLLVHLALARELDQRWSRDGGDAELFALLFHYFRALPRLTEAAEKRRVVERCLAGGTGAMAASAAVEAARFLWGGSELLSELGVEAPDDLAFAIHLALTEALFFTGTRETMEELFATCLRHSSDAVGPWSRGAHAGAVARQRGALRCRRGARAHGAARSGVGVPARSRGDRESRGRAGGARRAEDPGDQPGGRLRAAARYPAGGARRRAAARRDERGGGVREVDPRPDPHDRDGRAHFFARAASSLGLRLRRELHGLHDQLR